MPAHRASRSPRISRQRGIPFDCLEREADLGGLWNIATRSGIVYETTHLVSASYSTAYDDMPMEEEDYPPYPSHERVLGYFRDYVEKFGLAGHIEFGRSVERVSVRGDKLWEVSIAGEGRPRIYRGVVVASGHHDVPRMPNYPGKFAGEIDPLARLQEPTAGARQARPGGRLRQLGGRHRLRFRARQLARAS